MKRIVNILLIGLMTIAGTMESMAAVKEKTFLRYEQTLPVELQSNINQTGKIKKIVEDINKNGDMYQLYWLAQLWIGLDINTIEDNHLQEYFEWEKATIYQIVRQYPLLARLQDGRNFHNTFESSFYPRYNLRARLLEEGQMLQVLYSFLIKEVSLSNVAEQYQSYVTTAIDEERKIQSHYVERMLFGDDRYSCAHISPGPDTNITDSIASLLGKDVLKDPTLIPERMAALPEERDQESVDNLGNIWTYCSYYLSGYDLNLSTQYIAASANRLGCTQQAIERIITTTQKLYPTQYKHAEESIEDMRSNATTNQSILSDFVQYQDSLRRNGHMFVDYSLMTVPEVWQEDPAFSEYIDQYLRVGYALCKEIARSTGYTYIIDNADNMRYILRVMGYYHMLYDDNMTWMDRLIMYICDLNEITQYRYFVTSSSWMIGAAMTDHYILTLLLQNQSRDRMYEQLVKSVSFFYLALNNKEAAKSILEYYIFPVLPDADIVTKNKDWNCYHMWFYASVLPYTYLLYDKEEWVKELGKEFAQRLLQAVRYNKKCENNAQALSALVEYYYNTDSLSLGDQLLEEYFSLTDDSLSYYGYKFAINYWHTCDYITAARNADIVNRYDPTAMGSWYDEYCLPPARTYAIAGREESAKEQLEYFNEFMRKEIGKQLMSVGAEQASEMIKRYEDINNCFVTICEDSLSGTMKKAFMQSCYDWQLQSKGLLLALNTETDSLLAHHSSSYIRELYQRCKQREKAFMELKDKNTGEAVSILHNLMQAKNNLQSAVQEYIDKNGFEGVNQTDWEDVRDALSTGQVAIEMVNGKIGKDTIPVYYALLLRHDSDSPTPIRLFSEADINPLIETKNNQQIHQTYSFSSRGKQISQMVWGNILPFIREGEVVFFSPSGILHQIAIESLPYDQDHIMSDRYNMVRLSSTREITREKKPIHHTTATLYGNIRYSASPIDLAIEHHKYESQDHSTDLAMASPSRVVMRDMALDLPGTKAEVDSIENMLSKKQVKVSAYRNTQATEESFKSLSGKGPNIIHLATHGFYWPEKEAQRQKFFTQNNTIEDDVEQALPIDPLERCGLLFAGANTALAGHSERLEKGVQDGILTAKEISTLDLRGADIVVLSACETGLGDVSGDGVFGLQRAFKIAGAQTMLMALWKVDDDATRLLMTSFYRNMSMGMSKRQAFRLAQQEVRNYTSDGSSTGENRSALHDKYKNKGKIESHQPSEVSGQKSDVSGQKSEVSHPYASPYYWAGFILLD